MTSRKSTTKALKQYNAVHLWLHYYFGSATHCSNDPSHTNRTYQWANVTGVYSKDIRNFLQLCRSCHAKIDTSEYQRELSSQRWMGNTFRRKPVYQFTKEGEFVQEYPSLTHASAQVGVVRSAISNCLRGDTKTAGKFKWAYERRVAS